MLFERHMLAEFRNVKSAPVKFAGNDVTFTKSSSVGEANISCGLNSKVPDNVVVPLLSCKRSIISHLSYFHIYQKAVENEGELIKLRGGLFLEDISTLTVCPNHRQKMGLGICSKCRKVFMVLLDSMKSEPEVQHDFSEPLKGSSAADKGTLNHLKNIFNFRQLKSDIFDNFNHAWELMCLVTEG
ncbi:Hypothetical predicted protein [Mytilus galloprovincialis]|uniref:Uncharacterized protein n=1 Tax=Mytilus galloprovincialis TaxID=29158 RepID=A0A8B6D1A3_MYTGA|nr:Hypothetical predicted protein [Mytilus galloprovincialis]